MPTIDRPDDDKGKYSFLENAFKKDLKPTDLNFNVFIKKQQIEGDRLQKQADDVQDQLDDMKQKLLKDLPPAGGMVQKAINMCLDNIRRGYEVAHYKEVLTKLNKIKR